MDENLDKVERLNHLNTDSFWGVGAALFLLFIYNNYLLQYFFSAFKYGISLAFIFGLCWFVIFFMVQAGIIKVILRRIINWNLVIYSPVKGLTEFVRFVIFFLLGILFFSLTFNFFPFSNIYPTSLFNQVVFYLVSTMLSVFYWKYIENYKNKDIYVPKLAEYRLMDWFTIIFCLFIFGSVAVILPYTFFGLIGFGIWLIMISRFLLEKK